MGDYSIVEFTFEYFKPGDKVCQNTMDCYWSKEFDEKEIEDIKNVTADAFVDRYILKTDAVCLRDYKVVSDSMGEFGSVIAYDLENVGFVDVFDKDQIWKIADEELKRLQNEVKVEDESLRELYHKKEIPSIIRVLTLWDHTIVSGNWFNDMESDISVDFVKVLRLSELAKPQISAELSAMQHQIKLFERYGFQETAKCEV